MKKQTLLLSIAVIFAFVSCSESSQKEVSEDKKSELKIKKPDPDHQLVFEALRINDSLIFERGFNHCDTNQLKLLISEDFEFYHDQSGVTNSKTSFIQSIAGLCQLSYRPIRKLEYNSLEVHLLRAHNEIYGAIQHGEHSFYAEEENTPIYLTSTADFTHLWLIEKEHWRLKRVLSYNHQIPENEQGNE